MKKSLFALILCSTLSTAFSFSFINKTAHKKYDFNGIISLANCSGALVKFEGQRSFHKAIVMTNGHCLDRPFIAPYKNIIDKPTKMRMTLFDHRLSAYRVVARKIIFATMSKTDIALLELEQSYADIEKWNIEPFKVTRIAPRVGTPIEIISGFGKVGYTCSIQDRVFKLVEGSWTFFNSLKYSKQGCWGKVISSGSPVIEKGSRKIIGINNSKNVAGKKCSLNNPCEVDRNSNYTVIKGQGYGQDVFLLQDCLTKDFDMDLDLKNCSL